MNKSGYLVIHQRIGLALGLLLVLLQPAPLSARDAMTYIYHPPESSLDVRYEYHWEILRTALEKTKGKYGDYRMVPSEFMTESRQVYELLNNTGKLNVMYLNPTPELLDKLVPVLIPVDKGLVGYRVFLIRKSDISRFSAIRSTENLKTLTYGLGVDWVDVLIMRANGFRVVTGSYYEGLFEMLVNKRFDVFQRAVTEVIDEYEQHKDTMPDLAIEDSLLLYYPLPMYFWFPKTEEGMLMTRRAEEGMRAMIADGTYNNIFDKYFGAKIKRLKLERRKLFVISNPYFGPQAPFGDTRLWYSPVKK